MTAFSSYYSVAGIALHLLHLAAVIAGLVVSLRYRWLSEKMWLVVGALAALCGAAGIATLGSIVQWQLMLRVSQNTGMSTSSGFFMVAGAAGMLAQLATPAAWIALVTGLGLVWRDVSERLRQMRELVDERRPSEGVASDPG